MMKNLDDVAKEHGIDNIDLGNAVSAVIASRKAVSLKRMDTRGMSQNLRKVNGRSLTR